MKLPIGYKYRLFGSSRNSLGLGEYSIDHGEGRSTESTPPGTPADCEKNAVASEPSAMHVIVISSDTDGSTLVLPMCIEDPPRYFRSVLKARAASVHHLRCPRRGSLFPEGVRDMILIDNSKTCGPRNCPT
jgi:hypothetical protein